MDMQEMKPESPDASNEVQNQKRGSTIFKGNPQLVSGKKSDVVLAKDGWIPDKTKKSYHDQRLAQSKWAFRLSLWGCIAGFIVIFWGMLKGISTDNIEWVAIISGVILDAVAALFFYLNNKASEKISEFFQELTLDLNKKDAQKLVKEIKNDSIRDEVLVKLILHLSGIDDEKICKNTKEICQKIDVIK